MGTVPPAPPEREPSAAAMSCSNFCGSFSHSLNSGPSVWAAICAATVTSAEPGSAATNLTSLMRIVDCLLSPNVSLICWTTSWALEPPTAKAFINRAKSSTVTPLEK